MIRFTAILFSGILCYFFPITASSSSSVSSEKTLPAYSAAPPAIPLTSAQKEQLAKGHPIYPSIVDNGDGGGALAVFKVNAPAELVWKTISQFDQYPAWVDGVKKTVYYKPTHGDMIYVQYTVGKWFTPAYTYHIVHNFPKMKTGWGTWSLDTSMPNDLTACRGFWRVTPVADNPNQSLVEYSVDIKGESVMISIARPILLKNGVKDATSWVVKQAELAFAEHKAQQPKPTAANAATH